MLNDRINEEISLGVLWRMATRFSSANKRALHTHTRTHRGETSDSLYRFFLVGHFTLEIIHADTKKVVPLAAPDAWIFSTLWRVITQSSRSIILRASCYMKKNPPFFLRTPFSLPLPSFLSFFSSHSASSPRSKEVFKEKKEKRTCVPQEVNQS